MPSPAAAPTARHFQPIGLGKPCVKIQRPERTRSRPYRPEGSFLMVNPARWAGLWDCRAVGADAMLLALNPTRRLMPTYPGCSRSNPESRFSLLFCVRAAELSVSLFHA